MKILHTILLLLLFMPAIVYATTQNAEEIVRNTLDQVIKQMRPEVGNHQVPTELAYNLIQDLVAPHFDFPVMSRWVLDNNWNKVNQYQRQAFMNEFKLLMICTYAKTLTKFSIQKIKYFPAQIDPTSNLAIVKTEVWTDSSTHTIGSANTILINYKMHFSNDEWKVIDIIVDGISLVRSYRGYFASEIRENGFDTLISKLRDRKSNCAKSVSW